jgi:hypothetical protein
MNQTTLRRLIRKYLRNAPQYKDLDARYIEAYVLLSGVDLSEASMRTIISRITTACHCVQASTPDQCEALASTYDLPAEYFMEDTSGEVKSYQDWLEYSFFNHTPFEELVLIPVYRTADGDWWRLPA